MLIHGIPVKNFGPQSFSVSFDNDKGENILVVAFKLESGLAGKYDIMSSWVKRGMLEKPFKDWWSIGVYVKDKDGNYHDNKYNPQYAVNHSINFEWILDGATPENLEKLLNEVYRLANKKGE